MITAARNILANLGNLPLVVLLILANPTTVAQTDSTDPTASLQQARATLQQLDVLAATCMTRPGDQDACEAFRQAVNGELLMAYIENCAVAKRWRDDFVASQIETQRSNASGASETLLRHLVDIEYLCGENALTRATDSVLPAYNRIRSTGPSVNLHTQRNNWREQRLRDVENQRQRERLSSQRQYLQQQTTRQFDQLELEILRQQLRPRLPR